MGSLQQIWEWRFDQRVWIILRIHLTLSVLIPGYQIYQIKMKYGSLRYYFSPPRYFIWLANKFDWVQRLWDLAYEVVDEAEQQTMYQEAFRSTETKEKNAGRRD